MRWGVQLQGDVSDLEVLSKALKEDTLSIQKENEIYVLKSKEFDSLNDASSVKEVAESLLLIVNALGKLYFEGEANIRIVGIIEYVASGSKNVTVFPDTLKIKMKMKAVEILITKDGKMVESLPAQGVKNYWKSVYCNSNLLKAVRLFQKEGETWQGIYKIVIDIILRDGPPVVALEWVSQSKIDLLKHTANCCAAIGDAARHAIEWDSPSNPMSIAEARSITQNLLREWIQLGN